MNWLLIAGVTFAALSVVVFAAIVCVFILRARAAPQPDGDGAADDIPILPQRPPFAAIIDELIVATLHSRRCRYCGISDEGMEAIAAMVDRDGLTVLPRAKFFDELRKRIDAADKSCLDDWPSAYTPEPLKPAEEKKDEKKTETAKPAAEQKTIELKKEEYRRLGDETKKRVAKRLEERLKRARGNSNGARPLP